MYLQLDARQGQSARGGRDHRGAVGRREDEPNALGFDIDLELTVERSLVQGPVEQLEEQRQLTRCQEPVVDRARREPGCSFDTGSAVLAMFRRETRLGLAVVGGRGGWRRRGSTSVLPQGHRHVDGLSLPPARGGRCAVGVVLLLAEMVGRREPEGGVEESMRIVGFAAAKPSGEVDQFRCSSDRSGGALGELAQERHEVADRSGGRCCQLLGPC